MTDIKNLALATKVMLTGTPHILALNKDGEKAISAEGNGADLLAIFGQIMMTLMKQMEIESIGDLMKETLLALLKE